MTKNDSNQHVVSDRFAAVHPLVKEPSMTYRSTNEPEMPYLEERFGKMSSEYRELKKRCEAKVTAWQWASNDWYDPRPLWFERQGGKPGRLFKKAPKNPAYKFEYGFDEHGVVHVERQHIRFEGYPERIWFYEKFYVRGEDVIEISLYNYHPDKESISFDRGTGKDGRIELWESRGQKGLSRERYSWENDRVSVISVEHAAIDDGAPRRPLAHWNRFEAEYDEKGLLGLLCFWPGQPETVEAIYRRSPQNTTLKQMLSDLHGALVSSIVERVRSAKISDAVFSLVLAWDPGQDQSLPPHIGLGLERERSKWLRENRDDAKSYLWNPAEYEVFLSLESKDLTEICRCINQECKLRDSWAGVAKLLNNIAKELSARDWTGLLSTTEDFVAYATDLELTDFHRNLKASTPPSILKRLSKNGWLPD
jgi:hypothetical protein